MGGDTDVFHGLGLAYWATQQVIVSGANLMHVFIDIGGNAGVDDDADRIPRRLSFQF